MPDVEISFYKAKRIAILRKFQTFFLSAFKQLVINPSKEVFNLQASSGRLTICLGSILTPLYPYRSLLMIL